MFKWFIIDILTMSDFDDSKRNTKSIVPLKAILFNFFISSVSYSYNNICNQSESDPESSLKIFLILLIIS